MDATTVIHAHFELRASWNLKCQESLRRIYEIHTCLDVGRARRPDFIVVRIRPHALAAAVRRNLFVNFTGSGLDIIGRDSFLSQQSSYAFEAKLSALRTSAPDLEGDLP
jgi:hypothetical protein